MTDCGEILDLRGIEEKTAGKELLPPFHYEDTPVGAYFVGRV